MPESTTTNPYEVPDFDYSIPAAPTYTPQQRLTTIDPAWNDRQENIYSAYQKGYYRDPTQAELTQLMKKSTGGLHKRLSTDEYGSTYGRAMNEINPLIDTQVQKIYGDLAINRQRGQSQLEALRPEYEALFNSLGFERDTNTQALDALRRQIQEDTDFQGQELQSRFQPAAQGAYAQANRRGLLDSSISLSLLNDAWKPIQTGLANLYRTSQRQLTDAEQKRQSILQKYGVDYQNLVSKREQAAKSIRDELARMVEEAQLQASTVEAGRGAQVQSRVGELRDTLFNQGIQSKNLDLLRKQLQEQQRQFNKDLQFKREALNKK